MTKTDPPKLKIVFQNHGEIHSAELPWDSSLPHIMQNFCYLLVNAGWSREQIEELVNGEDKTPWWEWEVL